MKNQWNFLFFRSVNICFMSQKTNISLKILNIAKKLVISVKNWMILMLIKRKKSFRKN